MTPDFDTFCQLLAEDNAHLIAVHPAEIHGLYCGLLAAGYRPDAATLQQQISDCLDEDCRLSPDFMEFCQQSLQALQSDQFEFHPCLPDDDIYGLAERLGGLSVWCVGFLHGFAVVTQPLSAEAQELLSDLTEISQVDAESLDVAMEVSDEQDRDYSELTEFVRMAAISLFMDFNPSPLTAAVPSQHDYH